VLGELGETLAAGEDRDVVADVQEAGGVDTADHAGAKHEDLHALPPGGKIAAARNRPTTNTRGRLVARFIASSLGSL